MCTSENQCPHLGACSGCVENPSFSPPPVWQDVLSALKPETTPLLHQGSPYHWRHRAKVAVRGICGNPLIGLFKQNSHQVQPIPFCLVHHPNLNQAFEIIREWMIRESFIPYNEVSGLGDLRYLQGVVERASGKVQMTFVLNGAKKASVWKQLLNQLFEMNPSLWHSIWMNFNDRPTNTIFGPSWSHVKGEEHLWEQFGASEVCYGPASFGQANLPLFEKMLMRVIELLPPEACVAEFYAGVGAIGLSIAQHCQRVKCSEINPFAEAYFELSRARLSVDIATKLSFVTAPTHLALSTLEDASTVIVDPPRKGMDQSLLYAINEALHVKQLLYISCGWESFKKESQQLITAGWKLKSIDGYHFFPGTNHVELLANFIR